MIIDLLKSLLKGQETGPKSLVNGDVIKKWEGLRLEAYQDTGGVWTIGWGHTKTAKPGMKVTKGKAEKLFEADTKWAVKAVNELVTVPLEQHQFDALVSFVFNVGREAFRTSTLLKLLNTGDYEGAADQFGRWVYDDGIKLRGLVNRRADERKLFVEGEIDV